MKTLKVQSLDAHSMIQITVRRSKIANHKKLTANFISMLVYLKDLNHTHNKLQDTIA
jgi:hypothetical protein